MQITNFRRRHPEAFFGDELAQDYVLNEIQNSLTEISPALTLESFNLPVCPERAYDLLSDYAGELTNLQSIESIFMNPKKLNRDQKWVFNVIIGEILPEVTAQNLRASVQHQFNHKSAFSRTYFLDAPEEQGKHLLSVLYNQF